MREFAGRFQRLSVRTPGSFIWSTHGCPSMSPSSRSPRAGRCTTPMAASGWMPSASSSVAACSIDAPRARRLG
jgi:hypothetical protein